jgi:polyisoprenoid-binding protein YceI
MTWEYSPAYSRIEWAVQQFGLITVKGIFREARVTLDFEDPEPTRWAVSADIYVRSLDSASLERDDATLAEEYLDAERYPLITFRSTRVEQTGEGYRVLGDLTIKGTTRAVALDARIHGDGKDFKGNPIRGLSASTMIERSDFHVGRARGEPTVVAQGVRVALEVLAINSAGQA